MLRDDKLLLEGTQKGDIYSFGIVLYQIFGRAPPYHDMALNYDHIIYSIKHPTQIIGNTNYMRPDLDALKEKELDYQPPEPILGNTNLVSKTENHKYSKSLFSADSYSVKLGLVQFY